MDRHSPVATIRFTLPDPPAGLLDQVGRLAGVSAVDRHGHRVMVRGSRRIIAYVGAVLVGWDTVPDDLSVQVPTLEDATVTLIGDPR